MEWKEKVEIMQQSIKQLIEDEKSNIHMTSSSSPEIFVAVDSEIAAAASERHQQQFLSQLLSQLETLEEDKDHPLKSNEEANHVETLESPEIDEKIINSSNEERIIKELKNIQRQNMIIHFLLSASIILTLAWQLSEVSLILKIKNGLSNPLKAVGGILGGLLKGGKIGSLPLPEVNILEAMHQVSGDQKQVIPSSSFSGLKISEFPHLDLPGFNNNNNEEEEEEEEED